MISPLLTRPLTSLRSGDRPSVGGRAAGLGELTAAGLPVPAGFAVTTAAFGHALRALDPGGTIPQEVGRLPAADDAAIGEVSAQVRGRILGAPLPIRLRDEITAGYDALAGPAGAPPPGGARSRAGSPGAAGGRAA